MKKTNRFASTLLVAISIAAGISAGAPQAAVRQLSVAAAAKVSNVYAISWGDIWEKLRRKKGSGGGRGDREMKTCLMAPNRMLDIEYSGEHGKREVWHERPLFVWQGTAEKIALYRDRSREEIWSQTLAPDVESLAYDGPPLQPGRAYFWLLFPHDVPIRVYFKTMAEEERQKVAAELAELEGQNTDASAEELTLQRADYFAKRGLWSDALQEIFSVANPSEELVRMREEIERHDFCKEEK